MTMKLRDHYSLASPSDSEREPREERDTGEIAEVRGYAMKKLMIIDDDPRLSRVLGELMDGEGFETMRLTDARNAVEMCSSWQPDVILLDIMMPDVNGWDVLRDLKATHATREIPVIVHSASPRECQNVAELSRYSDVSVLPKPWDVDDLVRKVRDATMLRPV